MSDNLPPLPEFEKWLRSVCFQAPPSHAYDLARCAWIEAGRASLEASRAAAPAAPEQQEPTDSMGIPVSCGKPLCSPGDHHPLCQGEQS